MSVATHDFADKLAMLNLDKFETLNIDAFTFMFYRGSNVIIIVDQPANKVTIINKDLVGKLGASNEIHFYQYATDPLFEDIASNLSVEEADEKYGLI
jgi:hypothetical protein